MSTSIIRKLASPLMGRHQTGETLDAAESGIISGLTGLTLGFVGKKTGWFDSGAGAFLLIGAGVAGNVVALGSPLKHEGRENARAAGDMVLGYGFSKLGEKFAELNLRGPSHHGEGDGPAFGKSHLERIASRL